MINYLELLSESILFFGIEASIVDKLFRTIHYQKKRYQQNEVIAFSGDECKSLQIVLEGSVRGEMMDISGKVLKIEDIHPFNPLAIAFLFGENNNYPVTITANESTLLLILPRESVIQLMQQNVIFLTNFINTVSNRTQFIISKLKFLSFHSLRGKLAHFLLELDREQNGSFMLPKTQEKLAELFGVARPSLSRVLRAMHKEGILHAEGKKIKILDRDRLKEALK